MTKLPNGDLDGLCHYLNIRLYSLFPQSDDIEFVWYAINQFVPMIVIHYAKQKQPGCKKVRGQSEATVAISDQNL